MPAHHDSPPLARRTHCLAADGRHHRRPTSACAERPVVSVPVSRTVFGSPPLARRALPLGERGLEPVRFTSARAESTGRWAPRWSHTAAHLRSRGEHPPTAWCGSTPTGSPPLARRPRPSILVVVGGVRLASALAETAVPVPVHLRLRGDRVLA